MDWIKLNKIDEVEALKRESFKRPQLIFKHSVRCASSAIIADKLAGAVETLEKAATLYVVYVIEDKAVSDKIAELFSVYHQSPQTLLVINGDCVLEQSHWDVCPEEIISLVQSLETTTAAPDRHSGHLI